MTNKNKEILFAEERKAQIIMLLKENERLTVPYLCDHFKVSPATIRNDLRELGDTGMIMRTHGGAMSITKTTFELDSYQKEVENISEKSAIAKFAAKYVDDGDTIAIDTGTTTMEFAKCINKKKNVTVVVNDIQIARYLEENSDANIVLIGGIIRKGFHCSVGPIAIDALKGLSVDKTFLAINGINITKGLTTPDISQAEVKKAMIDIANEVIVLCDSSKIGKTAFVQVAPISIIHRIVTDDVADEKYLDEFRGENVDIDVVSI